MDYHLNIQKSIKYIEDNLCEELNLIDIAKQSHFSEFYFHKLFSKLTGASVMEFVRKRRLSAAAQDLEKTSEKITNIAFKYQFSSEESFSRAFKKVYGMSPRKYKNVKITDFYNENVRIPDKLSKHSSSRGITLSMAA